MLKTSARYLLILIVAFTGQVATVYSIEYGDIILEKNAKSMKKAEVNAVLFPHWFHRIRYKCKVCHEDIFVMQKGANDITMKKIMDGKACGTCHNGLVAWEPLYCDKCHSTNFTPAAGSKKTSK